MRQQSSQIPVKLMRLLAALFLPALVLLFLGTRTTWAQEGQGCDQLLRYLDLNGDGTPDAAVLQCQFEPGGNDQVTVVDGSNDMRWDAPWQEVVDFQNDTWIFDHQADGKANLIVVFGREGSSLVADLYDDRNGDGEVSYQIVDGRVEITENKWTVRVIAANGWWTKGSLVNFNLRILVDGDVEGMFMVETYRRWLATDGQTDFDIQVRDLDQDGRPDYDMRTQYVPWLQGSVGLGTQMMVNWADDEVPLRGGFQPWPYLDLSRTQAGGSRIGKGYQSGPPPIQFDPQTGRIEAVGEFVASRWNEHNCFFYSTPRWLSGRINDSNFESPFCFYDLAEDHDGLPELEVRQVYWMPNDPPFLMGRFPQPIQWIRYSWDQDNTLSWRYGLGLVGRHLVESVVTIGDYRVRTIPYAEFPYWVTERDWDLAVFAEVTHPYWTSEGMYAVSNLEDTVFQNYLAGRSDQPPSWEINPERGFRLEMAIDFNRRPFLYFGSVDRRLHLQGVQEGVWNIDDVHTVKYESLGRTGFVNSWTYSEGNRPEKYLFATDEFLIYADSRKVILQKSRVQPGIFATLPPRNHDEWVTLGQMLMLHKRDFAPEDFQAMMAQFDGPTTRIEGATLRDFRPTDNGFRFILKLGPGFHVAKGEDWLGVQGLAPGEYAVTYKNGAFRTEPLTPARPVLVPGSLRVEGEAIALHPVRVTSALRNEGLDDASSLPVHLHVRGPGGHDQVVDEAEVDLLAEEETEVSFAWTPPMAGRWEVWLTLGDQESEIYLDGEKLIIDVLPAPKPDLRWILKRTVEKAWPILGLGFGLAAVAGVFSFLALRPFRRGQTG